MMSMYAKPTAMTMSQELKTALMSRSYRPEAPGVRTQGRESGIRTRIHPSTTRQNKDMRTISASSALPTHIAGIYGMNFKNIPLV